MCGKPVRAEVFGMPQEETSTVALLKPTAKNAKTILCHLPTYEFPATHGFAASDKPSLYHPDGAESNHSDKLRYLFFSLSRSHHLHVAQGYSSYPEPSHPEVVHYCCASVAVVSSPPQTPKAQSVADDLRPAIHYAAAVLRRSWGMAGPGTAPGDPSGVGPWPLHRSRLPGVQNYDLLSVAPGRTEGDNDRIDANTKSEIFVNKHFLVRLLIAQFRTKRWSCTCLGWIFVSALLMGSPPPCGTPLNTSKTFTNSCFKATYPKHPQKVVTWLMF